MQIPNIFEVIYAPQKAFKKLAEHATIVAPLLILLIYLVANAGFFYASASKISLEQTVPSGTVDDEWTQNVTLWTSNGQVSVSSDFVNGTPYVFSGLYGNQSMAASITNSTEVWMFMQGVGPVNCTSPSAYDRLSFRLKWTEPSASPINVTIQLFSANSSGSFSKSLEADFGGSLNDTWNNETLQLDAAGWASTGSSADWSSITGMKLDFVWQETSNITLLIDGVYFHGPFEPYINILGSAYLVNVVLSNVLQFTITWIILGVLVYLIARAMKGQLVWRIVLVTIGLAMMPLFVLAVLNVVGIGSVPNINYAFELVGGFQGEPAADAAYNSIINQTEIASLIGVYGRIAAQVWIGALCAVAVRVLATFSWGKSIIVGAVASVVELIATSFLFGA